MASSQKRKKYAQAFRILNEEIIGMGYLVGKR
jgi:hypothetical protein